MPKLFINASNQSGNPYAYAGTNERVQMEKLAALLKDELDKYNCETKIATAYYIQDKAKEAKAWGADFAIALHSNAANGTASGTQGYYNRYYPVSKNIAIKLVDAINAINPNRKNASRIVDDYSYLDVYKFGELGIPSLLAEVAFHDNPTEARWIVENLPAIAKAIAGCLVAEYNLNLKNTATGGSTFPAGTLYRVQVGAFSIRANADRKEAELKALGYPTYMVTVGDLYKVQTGAFSKRENADRLAAELKGKGFDVFITSENGMPVGTGVSAPIQNGDKIKIRSGAIDLNTKGSFNAEVYQNTYIALSVGNTEVIFGIGPGAVTGKILLADAYKA